ncbi:MAG TPA: DUF4173 domain-containing protein [Saprospiraceae bacterium]|nr:DUF4173 domain-containing protein [Saprospiraceae bacterium]
MQTKILKNIFILLGALLYSYLFAVDHLGLNTFIFSLALFLGQVYFDRSLLRKETFRWISGAHLFIALMVVVHQSYLAQTMYLLSFLLWVGYSQLPSLRFLWYGMLLGIGSMMATPLSALKDWSNLEWKRSRILLGWARLIVIPMVLGTLFFVIYYLANDNFAAIFDRLFSWVDQIDLDWNWKQITLFIIGLLCMGAVLWPSVITPLLRDRESRWQMDLVRRRRRVYFDMTTLALKRHYFTALLSLSMLNALLLLVNILDLRYVWLDFSEKSAAQLSNFVHEGTSLLIIAILLAMTVVVYFFRGNLNFYPDERRRLRQLTYVWLVQNAVLAFSVGVRNYHYLDTYGLTSLRIGVMIFLLMVLAGLYFTFRKIRDRHTTYYLLSVNSWVIFLILTASCAFNWTGIITRYNLSYLPEERLDLYYLGEQLSDKNVLLLKKHHGKLRSKDEKEALDGWIKQKERRLRSRHRENGWRSWNWMDARIIRQIE